MEHWPQWLTKTTLNLMVAANGDGGRRRSAKEDLVQGESFARLFGWNGEEGAMRIVLEYRQTEREAAYCRYACDVT